MKATLLSIFNPYKGTNLHYSRPNLTFESITPHFNQDKRHFTPAFVLPQDQVPTLLTS